VKPIDMNACFSFVLDSAISLVFDAKPGTGRVVSRLKYPSLDVFLPDVINA
jgi:hypothetical protein